MVGGYVLPSKAYEKCKNAMTATPEFSTTTIEKYEPIYVFSAASRNGQCTIQEENNSY